MSHRGAYRRRRGSWQPTNRQREVLDLLVEGRSNAEIAEGLGITLDGAKWHIGELLAQTGCEDRRALASWWRERQDGRRKTGFAAWSAGVRYGWPALAVGLVVAAVLVAELLSGGDRGDDAAGPEAAADFAPSPTPTPTATPQPELALGPPPPCDTPLPGGFRVVTANELRTEGLVEFGRVIEPRSCPLQVSNRADMAFVWLADGGEIDLKGAGLHRVTVFGPYYRGSNYLPSDLGFNYQGEQFHAAMWVQDEGQNVFVDSPSPNLVIEVDGRDERVDLRRIGPAGAFASVTLEGEESGRHRVAFASDGRLFFDPEPLSGDLATNWITGEAIDLNGMAEVGKFDLTPMGYPTAPSTGCNLTTGLCNAGIPAVSLPIRLPVGGDLTCVPVMSAGIEREGYELDTGEYVLRFSPAGGYGMAWDGECTTVPAWRDAPVHAVSAGDEVYIWTYTSIAAFATDGSPLSAVMTRDGHLYVGEVSLELDCPCQIGH